MSFFRVQVRRESYCDVFVEASEDLSRFEVKALVKKDLQKMLEKVDSSEWESEEEEVDGIQKCEEEEAKSYFCHRVPTLA